MWDTISGRDEPRYCARRNRVGPTQGMTVPGIHPDPCSDVCSVNRDGLVTVVNEAGFGSQSDGGWRLLSSWTTLLRFR